MSTAPATLRPGVEGLPDPRRARLDLAAVLRTFARLGFHEGICNHCSVMLDEDRFLINPKGPHWSRVKASDLIVIDREGRTVEGEGQPARSGFCIHTRIHLGNPAARVVLHTHMDYATTLCALAEGELRMVHQNSTRYLDECAYDRHFNGLAFETEEGDRMARVMEGRRVLFLGNHGVVVVGDTIAEAFDDLYYLERACRVQVMAMWTGRPLLEMPPEMARATAEQFRDRRRGAELHLQAAHDILADEEPDYAR
jgi:ribulose-5-phosphate 4-epimerase/fuculose-1-phosphate aldolase